MKDMIFKTLGSLVSAEGKLLGLGWSDENRKFYSSGYRCPQCNERLLDYFGKKTAVNYYSGKREKIALWKLAEFRAEFAECRKCNYLWKIKGSSQPVASRESEILSVVETE